MIKRVFSFLSIKQLWEVELFYFVPIDDFCWYPGGTGSWFIAQPPVAQSCENCYFTASCLPLKCATHLFLLFIFFQDGFTDLGEGLSEFCFNLFCWQALQIWRKKNLSLAPKKWKNKWRWHEIYEQGYHFYFCRNLDCNLLFYFCHWETQ